MDDRLSSEQYRDDSLLERQRSQEIYNDYTPSAVEYAHDNGISLDQAYNHVLAQAGHDVEEVKWTRVPLNETDTPVGAEIQGKNISVVCNSIITARYNDTYVSTLDGDDATSVTFRQLRSPHNIHSGDKHTPYGGRGLRHVIDFVGTHEKDRKTFIMSAPWISGRKDHVQLLCETKPILEIRVDNDGELKRFIIPQDFSGGEEHTACVSAMVTREGEFWKVKILQKFINGYADDVNASISYLKQINFEDDLPSVACGDDVPRDDVSSFVDIDDVPSVICSDDVPSSMPSIVYCDEVPSFVPSDCYSNPVMVEHSSSDYQVEF
jgi:hypothetical protein